MVEMKNQKPKIINVQCVSCDAKYDIEPFRYQCDCGENLDIIYDYASISQKWTKQDLAKNPDRSHWRYLPILPVKNAPKRTMQIGGTPLIPFAKIAEEFGVSEFFVKDDTRNPSGSLKDRATDIGIQHATEMGENTIVAASTGNAAASLSALSAFYRKNAIILAPASAPKAKLTQILQYGATLFPVNGTYDDAFALSMKISEKYGFYSRSTGINPILSEGKKTVGLEIAEQLNWNVPDLIFVPTGDGCIIGGVYKSFWDLKKLGWIDKMPKLIAVQSEGSCAIVNALKNDGKIEPVSSKTIADSISVDNPADGTKALRAVKNSDGFGITVSDDEILTAQKELSEKTGIFTEPAAASSFAGFKKATESRKIEKNETVVILATGTGLKDIPAAQKKIEIPEAIDSIENLNL